MLVWTGAGYFSFFGGGGGGGGDGLDWTGDLAAFLPKELNMGGEVDEDEEDVASMGDAGWLPFFVNSVEASSDFFLRAAKTRLSLFPPFDDAADDDDGGGAADEDDGTGAGVEGLLWPLPIDK